MRKVTVFILTFAIILCMTACKKKSSNAENTSNSGSYVSINASDISADVTVTQGLFF